MEHRDRPDGSIGGTWWDRDAIRPYCEWTYDAAARMIHVTRASIVRSERVHEDLKTPDELYKELPKIAQLIANEIMPPR